MNRQEQYNKMLDEDNTMLVEENEILRDKITNIQSFVDKTTIEITEALKCNIKINVDYFIGQKSILNEIKKII